jgi:hypothetical protein
LLTIGVDTTLEFCDGGDAAETKRWGAVESASPIAEAGGGGLELK